MRILYNICLLTLVALLLMMGSGCNKAKELIAGTGRSGSSGLKPGVNYMQPMKWRMTYRYRVSEIVPNKPYLRPIPMGAGSKINAIGEGKYEVWFVGPREGEEIRDVKLVQSIPEPTKIIKGTDTDVDFYYFDFSPGNRLPDQVMATITWEFITFERYAHWTDMPRLDHNKTTELYREFTKLERPINSDSEIEKTVSDIVEKADGDKVGIALGCYNHVMQNFTYDFNQIFEQGIFGQSAIQDATQTWHNKRGICAEFSTVYCSMMRNAGIPTRPVLGFVHGIPTPDQFGDMPELADDLKKYTSEFGPPLSSGGHAWAEFYMPEVGWIPADPTWGQGTLEDIISPSYSYIGAKRDIPHLEYYFGKHDPYRITLFKDYGYTLNPPPKSAGAEPFERSFVSATERFSGVREMTSGYADIFQMWTPFRAENSLMQNWDMELKALGPVEDAEIPEIIDQIEEEGYYYLSVPRIKGEWPEYAAGRLDCDEWNVEINRRIRKMIPPGSKNSASRSGSLRQVVNLHPPDSL